jgi:hypothetical protein
MKKIDDLNKKINNILKKFGIEQEQVPTQEELKLRIKYQQLQKKKLADSLKCVSSTDKIKSHNNGR